MNKVTFIEKLTSQTGVSKKDVEKVVSAIATTIVLDVFHSGDKVFIPGLGTFKQTTLAAKMGRNPSTGASLRIPERKKLSFKATKL